MLSRRQFLQAAGIALAAPLARFDVATPVSAPNFDAVYGRALTTTPVYAAPSADAWLVKQLWSDTVVPIHETVDGWYRLLRGYAPRENLQPMIARARGSNAITPPPFWGEVCGAIAVIRASCSASAPIVARVGHSGILRVIDYLPGETAASGNRLDWYGVALDDDHDLLGWVFASILSPAQADDALPALALAISVEAQRLTVLDGDSILLTAPISTNGALPTGIHPITERRPNGTQQDEPVGAPWRLTFGDNLHLSGVYWHNRFGAVTPGAALQVTPPLAKWLYPRARTVIIS